MKSSLVPAGIGQEARISVALSLLAIIIFFFFSAAVFNLIEGEHPCKQPYKQTQTQIQTTAQCLFFFIYIFFFFCEGAMRQRTTAEDGNEK